MIASLSRLVVSVEDLDRALGFYRDILGLPAERRPGFATAVTDNAVEVLLHERPRTASDAAVAATFTVVGLDDVCDSWRGRGGEVVDPPADQPWGERMAVVRDADGHLVCLVEGP